MGSANDTATATRLVTLAPMNAYQVQATAPVHQADDEHGGAGDHARQHRASIRRAW